MNASSKRSAEHEENNDSIADNGTHFCVSSGNINT